MSNVMSRHHRTVRTPEQGYVRFGASGQLTGMGSYPLQSPKRHGLILIIIGEPLRHTQRQTGSLQASTNGNY